MNKLQRHCRDLERKVEFVFLNQNFYEEIVDDFVEYKKLYHVCSEVGGYYDPSKFYITLLIYIYRCTLYKIRSTFTKRSKYKKRW